MQFNEPILCSVTKIFFVRSTLLTWGKKSPLSFEKKNITAITFSEKQNLTKADCLSDGVGYLSNTEFRFFSLFVKL